MSTLSERLEIRLPPHTMEQLRLEAKTRGVSVGQVAREAIDLLLRQDRKSRVEAAEALFEVEAPVSDWSTMKREIEDARRKANLP
ncbi:MAG: ribbon-helix-helix protein, CopG family [Acidobacteria bacterium]|nr:ribbon-helix-helix protein, CopG family [Acidobacteriota bacterium]